MSDNMQYFRQHKLPHIWCPGCGHGTVLNAMVTAFAKIGLDKNNTAIVSGIGCSSRAPGYMDFNTLHTTHGRALAFATGVKHAKPEMKVVVIMGDGDCAAIGGNHFIHAARRNIDITAIVMNNSVYGMTSGQFSPTTPTGMTGTTAPYGNIERSFDISKLSIAAGATFVARSTSYHIKMLQDQIEKALLHKGFSVVEAIVQCPTYYGRRNKIGGAAEMVSYFKDHSVNVKAAAKMGSEELKDKILIGELHSEQAPEFTEEYGKMVAQIQASAKNGKGGH